MDPGASPATNGRPPDPTRITTISSAIALCLLFYLLIIPSLLIVGAVRVGGVSMPPIMEVLVLQLVAWPVLLGIAKRKSGMSWRRVYAMGHLEWPVLVPTVLVCLGGLVVLGEVIALLPWPGSYAGHLESRGARFADSPVVLIALAGVIVAPLCEEMFCRGWMLQGFLNRYSRRRSLLVSSAIFAVFHLDPMQAMVTFPLGLFLGWLLIRTGSLVLAISGHASFNASNFLFEAWFSDYGTTVSAHLPFPIVAAAVALLVFGSLWLVRALPRPATTP